MMPRLLRALLPDFPDAGSRCDSHRADSRRPHHPAAWRPARPRRHPAVAGRLPRTLGRRHAGRRDDQFQRQGQRSRGDSVGAGDDLRLIERFRRVDADTIDYQYTVTAPATFTRPWTAVIPFHRAQEKVMEYACHEGNYAMRNILSGARADDAAGRKSTDRSRNQTTREPGQSGVPDRGGSHILEQKATYGRSRS